MKKLLILLLLISSEAWAGNCKFYREKEEGKDYLDTRIIYYQVCKIEDHICVMNKGVYCFPKTKSK